MPRSPLSEYNDDELIFALVERALGARDDEPTKRAAAVVAEFQRVSKYVYPLCEMKLLVHLIAQELRRPLCPSE
jgi:hypothetical protein